MMGEELLKNGGDRPRQETMVIAGRAFGKSDVDVYAVSNGIFVTMHHDDQTRCTQVKYVPLSTPDLEKWPGSTAFP